MAYRKYNTSLAPDKDAGWGLIFRLNNLWAKVDVPAESGDYDHWNIILDRIFCNLFYRNSLEVIEDPETGKVLDVKIDLEKDKSYKVFTHLSKKIFSAKIAFLTMDQTNSKNQRMIAKSRWYHSVMMKDMWLRKFMQELGLYLKEIERSPGTALFGGGS
ncbi:hypothetical protein M0R04_08770 [Candidatus Dojkabacteria bacterium]|jgi:hypothetical protein|nr:hypothetical protein [Candidatus Dojkabacteria bacterium]